MIHTAPYREYAPVVLRLGLAAVYAWFGTSQLIDASAWVTLVPTWATGIFGLTAVDVVHLNGLFEVIGAFLLGAGISIRWVAGLLAVHLFVITSHLGFSAVGVRDFGLSMATLASALFGDDILAFHRKNDGAEQVVM